MMEPVTRVPSAPDARDRIIIKPRKRRDAVVQLIRSARTTLLLSIFRCDDLEVLQALGEAAARGVRVEVLVTSRAKGWGKRLAPLAACLQYMGVSVHRFPKAVPKYHAKYIIADRQTALIGTTNLTRKCFRRTRDFLFQTSDPQLVASVLALFESDLYGEPPAPLNPRLIVAPDGARERIEELLLGARRSIRIMDHKLSDPRILRILRQRQSEGIAIEVQQADPSGELTPHGRLLVIDSAVAVLGSLALSEKSLNERRELAVLIRQPELVAKLERQFDKHPHTIARAA
ncbi:MAG: phospholipase D-like domain-containing protein [Bryobacteraceae bacterium]|nr:phospholipase D-like domain-containing protein [Bryobacteraceae bacterium]